MKMRNVFLAMAATGVLVAVPIVVQANNATVTKQVVMSDEEYERQLHEIQTVGTTFGEFKRVEKMEPSSNVVNDPTKVDVDTEYIVTAYGVFKKQ